MVINAQARISRGDSSTIHLLESLFGRDPARYHTVSGYLARFARRDPSRGFDVICDDLMVNIEPDPSPGPIRDPRGRWLDPIHGWSLPFDRYRPCDPLRKPGSAAGTRVKAFAIADRYIYLCPIALDLPKGRSLAPYKDQVLAGKRIDDYTLTPVLLFHELLHSPLLLPDLRGKSLFHLAHGTISLPDWIKTRYMGQLSMKNYEDTLRCTWPLISA